MLALKKLNSIFSLNKLLKSFVFIFLILTFFAISENESFALTQSECSPQVNNRTEVRFTDSNNGTTWQVYANYYGKGGSLGWDFYASDGGGYIRITCYSPGASDYVTWMTACVDPNDRIDVNSTGVEEGGETRTVVFKDSVSVTCSKSRGSRYDACDNPNNKNFVGFNEHCPGTDDCASRGKLDRCEGGNFCGSGNNSCDTMEKYCQWNNSYTNWCQTRVRTNNSAACSECQNDNQCANDEYCAGCSCKKKRYSCDSGQCKRNNNGPYTSASCGGNCSGPIGGTVYIDGKANGREDNKFDPGEGYTDPTVQRGQVSGGNFDVRESRNPDPNYSFGGLVTGSDHDIRVQNWNNNRLNLESDSPRRNVRVANNNVDFRFSFKKFRVFGTVFWDPDGIPGNADDRRYFNNPPGSPGKVVRVCVIGQGCDDSDAGGANAGDYNITGVPTNLAAEGARYTVRVSEFKPAHNVTNNSQVINIRADNIRVNFYISPDGPPTYDIGGVVYLDDGDGALDPGTGANRDKPFKRSRVTVSLNPSGRDGQTSRGNGRYNIPDNPARDYTASITGGLGPNFAPVPGFESRSVTVGPSRNNIHFLVQRVSDPPGVISGGIFVDEDGDGVRDCLDEITNCAEPYLAPNWTGQRVTLNPGTVNKNGPDDTDGFYSFTNLTGTSYSVNLSRTGSGFTRTYPSSDTYNITNLGNPATCSVTPASSNAECTADGDVVNADFGITPSALPATPWIQGTGGDMRSDHGFDVTVPSGQYMSITQGSLASPGIIFNFDVSGNFSTRGWHVDDNGYAGKSIKTSHSSIKSAIDRSSAQLEEFFNEADSPCNGSSPNCSLPANVTNGFFQHTGNITLTTINSSFVAGRDYVFLVDGNLTINSNINVPPGATAMFIASGNITVASGVTSIEGIYSANVDFIVLDNPGNQLVIEGSVIGNALSNAANTTPFINNRTMGAANDTTPSVRFIYRPDFVLNAPNFINSTNYNFTEVAPPGTKP